MSMVKTVSGGYISLTDIKDIEFHPDALIGEYTIENYLKELLCKLWMDGDDFNAKRPFGNSGWQYEIYMVLIDEGIVEGIIDEDGEVFIDIASRMIADEVIFNIIHMDCV